MVSSSSGTWHRIFFRFSWPEDREITVIRVGHFGNNENVVLTIFSLSTTSGQRILIDSSYLIPCKASFLSVFSDGRVILHPSPQDLVRTKETMMSCNAIVRWMFIVFNHIVRLLLEAAHNLARFLTALGSYWFRWTNTGLSAANFFFYCLFSIFVSSVHTKTRWKRGFAFGLW